VGKLARTLFLLESTTSSERPLPLREGILLSSRPEPPSDAVVLSLGHNYGVICFVMNEAFTPPWPVSGYDPRTARGKFFHSFLPVLYFFDSGVTPTLVREDLFVTQFSRNLVYALSLDRPTKKACFPLRSLSFGPVNLSTLTYSPDARAARV